jgi:uracil permease
MIQKVDLDQNKNLFVVAVILICGIGNLVLKFGDVELTEIACALILGIITNTVLAGSEANDAKQADSETKQIEMKKNGKK